MSIAIEHWRVWLRAIRQAATLLGLAMIALTWIAVELYLRGEHDNARRATFTHLQNLARAFEVHVGRSVQDIDKMLLILRTAYARDPQAFDFVTWLNEPAFRTDLLRQFTITDPDGIVILSSKFPITRRVSVAHLDHVQIQMETRADRLVISAPSIGLTSGQWSVQLTRRILASDGTFLGIISAAVNPDHFSQFYDSIDIGKDGLIALIGFDGIIRASVANRRNMLGNTIVGSEIFRRFRQEPVGSHDSRGRNDGIKRLISYRVVDDYPLLVMVGAAEFEVLADFRRKQTTYRVIAGGVTILILIVVAAAARNRARLERAREALVDQFDKFRAAINNMSQGLVMFDADQRMLMCNNRYLEMYRCSADEIRPGMTLAQMIDKRIEKGLYAYKSADRYRQRAFVPGESPVSEVLHFNDGRVIALTRRPMPGGGWVATHEDITERERTEARIAYMARHDALTDLANRVLMRERLDEALARLAACGEGFAILSIDLDRFKFINDTMGHPLGDRLLREVAARLRGCATEFDTVARIGGDEFAILQGAMGDAAEAADLAERVLTELTRPYRIDGHELIVGASIGIAIAPRDGSDTEELSKNADLALYRAKAEGRNKFLFFEGEMNAAVIERRDLELALRGALQHGEFELFYQPILDLEYGRVRRCEALLRWRRPGSGLVLPGRFIAVAEEIGLIAPLGEWVLRQACAEAARWEGDARIAVNLSPAQFKSGNITAVVMGALAASGVAPERLELEITETVLLHETEQNLAALHQLRRLGVRIAFDDFGIGYSSLGYLTAFPFDTIKIDRRFTRDMGEHAGARAIVHAVAGIGRTLGIETIAEGVETAEQLAAVAEAGCTSAQGYFVSVPLPATQLAGLARRAANDEPALHAAPDADRRARHG